MNTLASPTRQQARSTLSFTPAPSRTIQRKCACGGTPLFGGNCDQCSKKQFSIQRRAGKTDLEKRKDFLIPPIVHEVLRSPGQPIDGKTRAFMESGFGHDFSDVRVHTGARAEESARAVNALAYTVGQDVVFGPDQYSAETREGRRLIAHELAHTIQQTSTSPDVSSIADLDGPSEKEAESATEMIIAGNPPPAIHPAPAQLVCQTDNSQSLSPSNQQAAADTTACIPASGVPNTDCSAYLDNAWWLPLAYVNNATCACNSTPNVPTANCVRKFLQSRLAATPASLKAIAATQKILEVGSYPLYQAFVQTVLTPRIYQDHVDAYRSCCCPSGPAPYVDWIGVTSVPIQPCSLVGLTIRYFGSCSGTPGEW